MAAAEVETTTFTFSPIDRPEQDWIAKGEVILFPGFMKLYIEGTDEEIEEDGNMRLPKLSEGEQVKSERLDGMQKFSLPPARYTEASLVKKLDTEGI
jgi:DNA topoisomerase-1